eukprot:6460232-Amphidinium_carterae.1
MEPVQHMFFDHLQAHGQRCRTSETVNSPTDYNFCVRVGEMSSGNSCQEHSLNMREQQRLRNPDHAGALQ